MLYTTKRSQLFSALLGIGMLLSLLLAGVAFAQDSSSQEDLDNTEDAEVLADVNIYDTRLVSQDENVFTIAFRIKNNGEEAQPDVRYSVELIEFGEGEFEGQDIIVDERVYEESLSLSAGESVNKEIVYEAPGYLQGEFKLGIFSQNTRGFPFAIGSAGTVSLNGTESLINIDQRSCVFGVNVGTQNEEFFDDNLDFAPDEDLSVVCSGVSQYEDEITATPQLITTERTSFGEEVLSTMESPVEFAGEESFEIIIPVEKPDQPQAYNLALSFVDAEGNVVSNTVSLHYVLQGESGTIQNVSFDKDSYKAGDTAVVTVLATGFADGFAGSRAVQSGERVLGEMLLEIVVADEDGNQCSEPQEKRVDGGQDFKEDFFLPITRDCAAPTASVVAKDSQGNVLDEQTFTLNVADTDTEDDQSRVMEMIIGALVLLAAFFIIVAYNIYHRKESDGGQEGGGDYRGGGGASTGFKSLLIIFVLFGGLFVADVNQTEAKTLEIDSLPHRPHHSGYAVFNLNKEVYAPGESVKIESRIKLSICSNRPAYAEAEWDINSSPNSKITSVSCGSVGGGSGTTKCSSSKKTRTKSAPQSPGSHRANIKMYMEDPTNSGARDSETGRIKFTVEDPEPSVDLSASPNPVDYETSSTLSWSVNNADQCTASGDWSGAKSTSGGSEPTGALTSNKTYNILCTNDIGSASDSVTVTVNAAKACQDGLDNDEDGNFDYPNDPNCSSPTDDNESPTQCNDGIDNDGDGWIDYPADPGCENSEDNDESNTPENPKQCEDGINNDPEVDDLIDGNDPGCLNANDDNETEAPDFSLTKTNELEITIVGDSPQASNSTMISSDVSESFSSDINLSVQSISPNIPGISYDWSENNNLTSSEYRNNAGDNLTVTIPGSISSGEYLITVQGVGGGLTRTIDIILNVQARDPLFENT